jgi:hypothetical protein
MKKFELTLIHRNLNECFTLRSENKIEADDMIHLLSQFQLVVASVTREIMEDEIRQSEDDDIPF